MSGKMYNMETAVAPAAVWCELSVTDNRVEAAVDEDGLVLRNSPTIYEVREFRHLKEFAFSSFSSLICPMNICRR